MLTLIFLGVLFMVAVWCIATTKHYLFKRAEKVYCYFEWEYKGERGSSRDYGPMLEIDAVGAMNYRQSCGAVITFEEYSTDEENITDLIDQREYMFNQQNKRRRG